MRITQISLNNLGPLAAVTLNFDEKPLNRVGLIGILGPTGSGKSTILDAMTLALFGSVARDAKPTEMMSHGAASCQASVIFEHGAERYASQWTLHKAGNKATGNLQQAKMQLSQWSEGLNKWEIIESAYTQVKNKVEKIIGLDEQRFLKSVMLAQGAFAAFLESKAAERSELLEKITGTEIYSDLSKAAFEKQKAEKDKLQNLATQISFLNIWDEATRTEKQDALQALEAAASSRQQRLDLVTAHLNIAEKRNNLAAQVEARQLEASQLAQERQNMEPQLTALANHEKTAHLHSDWQGFNQLQEQRADLLVREQNLDSHLKNESKQIPAIESRQSLLKNEWTSKQADFKSRQPVWSEVNTLDVQISEKTANALTLEAAYQATLDAVRATNEEVQKRKQTIATLQSDWQQVKEWLANHPQWQDLLSVFPTIKQLGKEWETTRQTAVDLEADLAIIEVQLKETEGKVAQKKARVTEVESALHPLKSKLEEQLRTAFPNEQSPSSASFFQQLDTLQTQREQWQELSTVFSSFTELQKQQIDWENTLKDLTLRKDKTEAAHHSAAHALEIAKQEKAYKDSIYQQQRLIADYAKDRADLKEGDPCPLCFSKEHPFRALHTVTPFVDKAKEESEAAESNLHLAQERYTTLLVTLQKETEAWSRHQANTTLKETLLATEATLATYQKIDFLQGLDLKNQVLIEQTGLSIQKKREELSSLQQKCTSMEADIQRGEQALSDATDELKTLQQTWAVQQNEWELKKKASQSATAQHLSRTQELSKVIETFLPGIAANGIAEALDNLSTREAEVRTYQNASTQYAQQLEIEEPLLSMAEQQYRVRKQEENQRWTELQQLQAAIASSRAKRMELMGDRMPSEEQREWEEDLKLVSEELSKIEKELGEKRLEVEKTSGILQNTREQIASLSQQISQIEYTLEKGCLDLGIPGASSLEHSILTPASYQQYLKEKQQLEQREATCQRLWQENQSQLQEMDEAYPELPSIETIRSERDSLSLNLHQDLQQVGSLKNELANQEQQLISAAGIRVEIAKQELELKRWSELNELIGSASGAKFRTIAQGFTLENLIIRANQHLDKLSGRYIILRNPGVELEMHIMDTYMANSTRSMGTLSGGERFQVSLALALGLSEMAGQDVQIQSLFIDEGFGTLDEQALDNALSTLENLQAGGKTICIISHVRELRERLSVKVQVEKGQNGRSRVQLVER